jgi:hypothetical protein
MPKSRNFLVLLTTPQKVVMLLLLPMVLQDPKALLDPEVLKDLKVRQVLLD